MTRTIKTITAIAAVAALSATGATGVASAARADVDPDVPTYEADPGPDTVADPAPAEPASEQPTGATGEQPAPTGSGPSEPTRPARTGINRIVVVKGKVKPKKKRSVRKRAALRRLQRAALQDLREAGFGASTVVYRTVGTRKPHGNATEEYCDGMADVINTLDEAISDHETVDTILNNTLDPLKAASRATREVASEDCWFVEVD
jgi:hypothetical protein